jgi:hypothetical protein
MKHDRYRKRLKTLETHWLKFLREYCIYTNHWVGLELVEGELKRRANKACSGREAGPAEEVELYREQLSIAHEEILRKASRR